MTMGAGCGCEIFSNAYSCEFSDLSASGNPRDTGEHLGRLFPVLPARWLNRVSWGSAGSYAGSGGSLEPRGKSTPGRTMTMVGRKRILLGRCRDRRTGHGARGGLAWLQHGGQRAMDALSGTEAFGG